MLVVLRILIGALFVTSGGEKLLGPYQNFLYVVQGYSLFPAALEEIIARLFPWVEFVVGLFILLGLFTKEALTAGLLMCTGFILVVGQAMIRQLPIDECGCFGQMIHLPLKKIILFDSALFLFIFVLLRNTTYARRFGLDGRLA